MWQCDLQQQAPFTLVESHESALLEARDSMKATTQYTEAALAVARRTLHDFDLVPHFYSGTAHSRAYFLLLELAHAFDFIRQSLKQPYLRTLHLDMGPGGFVDALLTLAPAADWHATSTTEVYEHIRTAKKPNGHARLLHNSIVQEVGDPMFVTIQGAQIAANLTIALEVLHPNGILLIQCDNPYTDVVSTCLGLFGTVIVCKPLMVAPSFPEFVVVACNRRTMQPNMQSWLLAREHLAQIEITGITRAMQLATYLTQVDIKTSTDTQKFYLDYVATNPARMEKAQRVLSKITLRI